MGGVIVVGVDGSPQSTRAVDWALREAAAQGDEVTLVHAWEFPAILTMTYGGDTIPVFTRDDVERLSDRLLAKAAAAARERAPGVTVSTQLMQGHPADVLVKASEKARLLVVGSRGLGGFRGMVMGSVSASCAHHVRCPLVIVPPT